MPQVLGKFPYKPLGKFTVKVSVKLPVISWPDGVPTSRLS